MNHARKLLTKLKNYWYLIPEAPENRNYFGFNSPADLSDALRDPDITYDYAGSPLPRALYRRHHSTTFPFDAPYALAWTRYHDDEEFLRRVWDYKGFLIVNDTLDQLYPIRHLYRLCRERGWVYIKHQRVLPSAAWEYLKFRAFPFSALWYWRFISRPYTRLQMGMYNPTKDVVKAFPLVDTRPEKDRPIDILFIGSPYRGRQQKADRYAQIARQLGLNFVALRGGLAPQAYLEKLSEAKIALSFVGWAPRCRREWEIPLAGALMLNDADLKRQTGGRLPLLVAGEHFLWEEADRLRQVERLMSDEAYRLKIAAAGQQRAAECFVQSPTIEWRLIERWMLDPDFQWDGNYLPAA